MCLLPVVCTTEEDRSVVETFGDNKVLCEPSLPSIEHKQSRWWLSIGSGWYMMYTFDHDNIQRNSIIRQSEYKIDHTQHMQVAQDLVTEDTCGPH